MCEHWRSGRGGVGDGLQGGVVESEGDVGGGGVVEGKGDLVRGEVKREVEVGLKEGECLDADDSVKGGVDRCDNGGVGDEDSGVVGE